MALRFLEPSQIYRPYNMQEVSPKGNTKVGMGSINQQFWKETSRKRPEVWPPPSPAPRSERCPHRLGVPSHRARKSQPVLRDMPGATDEAKAVPCAARAVARGRRAEEGESSQAAESTDMTPDQCSSGSSNSPLPQPQCPPESVARTRWVTLGSQSKEGIPAWFPM